MADWPKAVVFDLDGTLVDSAPDIAAALDKLLEQDGMEPFSLAQSTSFIGHGIKRLVERAYETRGQPLEGQALTDKVAVYQDIYLDAVAVKSRAYPGAVALVKALRAKGIKTGVCTNKTEPLTQGLLAGLDLRTLFDAVVGGQPGLKAKPDAAMLTETLRRLNCAPEDAIMLGDSVSDVSCARAAGVRVVGVSFGYTDVPMRDLGPDAVIDHFDETLAAIDGLRAKA